VHAENEGLRDLDAREIALLVPGCVLVVWIGVAPNAFLSKAEPAVTEIVRTVERARLVQHAALERAESDTR
jgi:NADH-quinone oxidoreductase subunit M